MFYVHLQSLVLLATVVRGHELVKIMSGNQLRLLHAAMDADSNELVTIEEGSKLVASVCVVPMQTQSMSIMQTMDTNKDSLLSLDEFQEDLKHFKMEAVLKEDFVNRFASFDDTGDGLLSMDEVLPLFNFMFHFQKLDENKDGLLTFKEFEQVAAAKLQNAPPQEVKKSNVLARSIFRELDTDGDKRINAKEHFIYESGIYAGLAAWKALFKLADGNKDSQVSAEELVACRENPKFGGSAAYHHSKSWITALEDAVKKATSESEEEL
jgi:Ca2+-binding EF-hand superfamily protein